MSSLMQVGRQDLCRPFIKAEIDCSGSEASGVRSPGRTLGVFNQGSGTFGRATGQRSNRVMRGDDLFYLWKMERNVDNVMRLEDKLISQNLTTMWETFAKTGWVNNYDHVLPF